MPWDAIFVQDGTGERGKTSRVAARSAVLTHCKEFPVLKLKPSAPHIAAAMTLACSLLVVPAHAQFNPINIVEILAKDLVAENAGTLEVSVPGGFVDEQGIILPRYTSYGDKLSPPLEWSAGPEGTKGYAVIMQDENEGMAFLHWAIFNIPANVTSLPADTASDPAKVGLSAAQQLKNSMDRSGYLSPGLPGMQLNEGYTPQVFALDTMLDLPEGVGLQELLDAMEGHVLAVGFVQGAVEDPAGPANSTDEPGTR